MKMERIAPTDLTPEDWTRLSLAKEIVEDKQKRGFTEMVRGIIDEEYILVRVGGKFSGLLVLNPAEGEGLNIYYLCGTGLWGRVRELASKLLDIAEKAGQARVLTFKTSDERKARLFAQVPGIVKVKHGYFWYLELNDGRR